MSFSDRVLTCAIAVVLSEATYAADGWVAAFPPNAKTLGGTLERMLTPYSSDCGVPDFKTKCSSFSFGDCDASRIPLKLQELPLGDIVIEDSPPERSALYFAFSRKSIVDWKTNRSDPLRYVGALAHHGTIPYPDSNNPIKTNCAQSLIDALKAMGQPSVGSIDSDKLAQKSNQPLTVRHGRFQTPLAYDLSSVAEAEHRIGSAYQLLRFYDQRPEFANASVFYIDSLDGVALDVNIEGKTHSRLVIFDSDSRILFGQVPGPAALVDRIYRTSPNVGEDAPRQPYVSKGIPASFWVDVPGLDGAICEKNAWEPELRKAPGLVVLASPPIFKDGLCRFEFTFTADERLEPASGNFDVDFDVVSKLKIAGLFVRLHVVKQYNPSSEPVVDLRNSESIAEESLLEGEVRRSSVAWRFNAAVSHETIRLNTGSPPSALCSIECDGKRLIVDTCEAYWTRDGVSVKATRELRDEKFLAPRGSMCQANVYLQFKTTDGVPVKRIISKLINSPKTGEAQIKLEAPK